MTAGALGDCTSVVDSEDVDSSGLDTEAPCVGEERLADAEGAHDFYCDELQPAMSVIDAALLTPLLRKTWQTRFHVSCWAFLSMGLQFVTSAFLYLQLEDVTTADPSFYQRDADSTRSCAWVDAGADPIFGTLHSKSMVCADPEVLLLRNFSLLDLDGDGRWTFEEAQQQKKEASWPGPSARAVAEKQLPDIYLALVSMMREGAQKVRTVKCEVGDHVMAYIGEMGYAFKVTIIGRQIVEDPAVIVRRYGTIYRDFYQVSEEHLYPNDLDEFTTRCRIPDCVDTDFGRTDVGGGPCNWYYWGGLNNGGDMPKLLSGEYNDNDFNASQLCCIAGGGSSEPNITGLGSFPANLAMVDFLNAAPYHKCELKANSQTCLRRFSYVPQELYEQEIAPILDICMLGDPDVCGNIISRGAWPNTRLQAWIRGLMDNGTIPLYLKLAGMTSTTALAPLATCKTIVSEFCPRLFPDLASWNAQRLQTCGQIAWVSGPKGAVAEYAESQLYNGHQAVRSLLFQIFLAWIVLLWALAMVPEFQQLLLWWEALLGLPAAQAGQQCVVKDASGSWTLVALPRFHRIVSAVFVLTPDTILHVFIFVLGVKYLFVVRLISDLILNSLALTFLVTIDDMLFIAFGDALSKRLISNLQTVEVERDQTCLGSIVRCLHRWQLPLGLVLYFPLLLAVTWMYCSEMLQAEESGDALACLCEKAGDSCFTAIAFGGSHELPAM